MHASLINYLRLFRAIPEVDAELIIAATTPQIFKEGEILLQEGKISRRLFFISKGVLRIVAPNDQRGMVTHFFLKENQFCTILTSFNQQTPSTEGIEAACDCEVLVIAKEQLMKLYETLPYLKDLIGGIMQQALLDKIALRNAYHGHDAATRYNLFLMRHPDIALCVSLSDIASYLGITPQSLSCIRRSRQ